MNLTWKDTFATAVTAAVLVVAFAMLNRFSWPLLGSYRTASLIVLGLGFATCIAVGSDITSLKSKWARIASVLGVAAFVLGIFGMLFASKAAFLALVIIIFTLWAVSSLRHLFGATPGLGYR